MDVKDSYEALGVKHVALHEGLDLAEPSKSYTAELGRVLRLAVPTSLLQFIGFAAHLVASAYVGGLGKLELSAFVVASSFYNITGLSLVVGIGHAMPTFCGQAFGARRYRSLGTVLQRAVLIMSLTALLPMLGWRYAEQAMTWMGVEGDIAREAAVFVRGASPSLLLCVPSLAISNYLMSQNAVTFLVAGSAGNVLLALGAYWLFVHVLGGGLLGAAHARVVVECGTSLIFIALALAINAATPAQRRTWGGLTKAAWRQWLPYLRVALPAMAMLCLEWWLFEALNLLAGALPHAETAAAGNGIAFNLHITIFMLISGAGVAAYVRCAQELGAGDARGCRHALLVCGSVSMVTAAAVVAALPWAAPAWVALFSDSPAVAQQALDIMPYVGLMAISDGFNVALNGVVRAAGHQAMGGVVYLTFFWLLGMPLAYYLAFTRGHGAVGCWQGLLTGAVCEALTLALWALRRDWRAEVEHARSIVATCHAVADQDSDEDDDFSNDAAGQGSGGAAADAPLGATDEEEGGPGTEGADQPLLGHRHGHGQGHGHGHVGGGAAEVADGVAAAGPVLAPMAGAPPSLV